MALISCPECNKQISDKADICISCGAPSKYIYIIDRPIEIMGLIIAQYDFPNPMSWDDAKKVCTELGDGWRLPTKDELNILFKNKVKIGGFSSSHYWSSREGDEGLAWDQSFDDGFQGFADMNDDCNVLAVRA